MGLKIKNAFSPKAKNAGLVEHTKCPAKTYCPSPGSPRVVGMNVREHCVTVGYVAKALFRCLNPAWKRLVLRDYAILAALHDVGKVSPGFLKRIFGPKMEKFCKALFEDTRGFEWIHPRVTEAEVKDCFPAPLAGIVLGAMEAWHHGRRDQTSKHACAEDYGGKVWSRERKKLVSELVDIFGNVKSRRPQPLNIQMTLSLICLSDWIASDENYFDPAGGLSEDEIRDKAKQVVASMGWGKYRLRDGLSFRDMFKDRFNPTELQSAVMKLMKSPGVIIVEERTGMGKTEAALAATYVALKRGFAHGLYFGLPTRLTSNKIHERVVAFLEMVSLSGRCPRLIHGLSWTTNVKGGNQLAPGGRWFSPNRRAILEPFGVGTVDQALMGILNLRFNWIRLSGLAGKVVVLDEVHSYDTYTNTLVCQLVRSLERMGCTVVILSATLTRRAKACLLGCKLQEVSVRKGYPLITVKRKNQRLKEVQPGKTRVTKYRVRNKDSDTAIDDAVKAALRGANVVWVMNTVPEAVEVYLKLRRHLKKSGIPLGILHSRFLMPRRGQIEDDWMNKLGPKCQSRPVGSLLVSTQIVEQSVDIDCDILVTAMCPSDFLIQRAGRNWRHRNKRPSWLRTPEMWILGVDVIGITSEKELREAFGLTALIYHPFVLWRSAKMWQGRKWLVVPDDTRYILEHTYKKALVREPEWAKALYEKLEDRDRRKGYAASEAMSKRGEPGYDYDTAVDAVKFGEAPTRRAEVPTAQIVICQSAKVSSAGGEHLNLTLYDGSVASVPLDADSVDRGTIRSTAIDVSRNMLKVPESRALGSADESEDYLASVVFGHARVAILDGSEKLRLISGKPSGYCYNDEIGAYRTP